MPESMGTEYSTAKPREFAALDSERSARASSPVQNSVERLCVRLDKVSSLLSQFREVLQPVLRTSDDSVPREGEDSAVAETPLLAQFDEIGERVSLIERRIVDLLDRVVL